MAGRDLAWFFDAYFYQAALPELLAVEDGDALLLAWRSPSPLAFEMPVEVRVGDTVRRVEMKGGRGRIVLPDENTAYLLDPANRILKHDAMIEAWQNRETRD